MTSVTKRREIGGYNCFGLRIQRLCDRLHDAGIGRCGSLAIPESL